MIKQLEKSKKQLPALDTSLQYLKGVGPYLAGKLQKMGLSTLEDVLFYLPHRYLDKRNLSKVKDLFQGERIVLKVKMLQGSVKYLGRRRVYEWAATDGSGVISLLWFYFKEKYMKNRFDCSKDYLVTGTVSLYKSRVQIIHPEVSEWDDSNLGIEAIYPLTEGVNQKKIRSIVGQGIACIHSLECSPLTVRADGTEKISTHESIRNLHLPPLDSDLEALNGQKTIWHKRIIYDELFYLQLGLLFKKKATQSEAGLLIQKTTLYKKSLECLPYTLTEFQNNVLTEIFHDFKAGVPMNRLLQGDVGSGKTIVSFLSALPVIEEGYQAVLMAPTEILAEQHFINLGVLARDLGLTIGILKGSTPKAERKMILSELKEGKIQLLIGTHVVFSDDIVFKSLGYIIIDEQHRFGVLQRAKLKEKAGAGIHPHVLVMTATPIPRTLSMTLHGDLDLSLMKGRPKGRKPIKTRLIYESRKSEALGFILQELKKGAQAYFVYPLVDESEKSDLLDATNMALDLSKNLAPFRVGLLHGKMKSSDKDEVMRQFKNGTYSVLVSTTVIEVGVDVPKATIMVIEHAERFGLSQLHQLRGRVGRGGEQSYCFLFATYQQSEESRHRLKIMEQTEDGFVIAEEDLKIRGPGDFMGTRQSGLPEFKLSYLLNEERLLLMAKTRADEILSEDPDLKLAKHASIKNTLKKRWQGRIALADVS